MDEPVSFQLEDFFPLVKVEAVLARLVDQFGKFARWQLAHYAFRVNADPEKHLILDYVSYAGKDALLEQGIANIQMGKLFQLSARSRRIPLIAHDIS